MRDMLIVGRRSNFPSLRRNHNFSPVARLQFRLSTHDKSCDFFSCEYRMLLLSCRHAFFVRERSRVRIVVVRPLS